MAGKIVESGLDISAMTRRLKPRLHEQSRPAPTKKIPGFSNLDLVLVIRLLRTEVRTTNRLFRIETMLVRSRLNF